LDFEIKLSLIIIGLTYLGIAVGEFPPFRSNRTTIALIGVGILVVSGVLKVDEFLQFIDIDTIILLFSMMIINANLRFSGFFQLAAHKVIRISRSPKMLLLSTIFLSSLLSAIFLNDTICLILTPFIIEITKSLKRNPIPYLIALATAANIGSVATLTGNPQNMIIGVSSNISYLAFLKALSPIAIISSIGIWLILVWIYPNEFTNSPFDQNIEKNVKIYKPLFQKSLIIISSLLIAFLIGLPISTAAFIAACALLITRRIKPEKVFMEIDWGILVFFSSLFILTGVLNESGAITLLFSQWNISDHLNLPSITFSSIVLSNLVSNVPAVLLLKPIITGLANPDPAWLTLASSSTLAGNLTLLGSVANLIVAESAAHRKITLTFWEYTRAGILITIFSFVVHFIWMSLFVW